MRTLARFLVGVAALNVWRRCFATRPHGCPVSTPRAAHKSGGKPHVCAVCRERAAEDGDLCDPCSVWVTGMAYANRDACEERAS